MEEICFSSHTNVGFLNGQVLKCNRLTHAVCRHSFGEWPSSTLGSYASSSTTHAVHAPWCNTTFSPQCQTSPNKTFGSRWRWIGRGNPVKWSAQLLDLNPLELWLSGHLMFWVYSEPMNDFEVIKQRAEYASQELEWNHEFSTKNWNLCRNAWEPHNSSSVVIT
jgi:hypothetical protein